MQLIPFISDISIIYRKIIYKIFLVFLSDLKKLWQKNWHKISSASACFFRRNQV